MLESPQQLAWRIAGSPRATKLISRKDGRTPVKMVPHVGVCATCAGPMSEGMPVADVLNETFSQHADFLKYGTHVCPACAWFYTDPKQHHRAFIAAGNLFLWPVLGEASATESRPLWRDALRRVVGMPADTPVVALLTTDPKPRLWPRVQHGTVGAMRVYVHSLDDDLSAVVEVAARDLVSMVDAVSAALSAGFSKATARRGLLTDHKAAGKDMERAFALEAALAPMRGHPAFIPAVLVAVKS